MTFEKVKSPVKKRCGIVLSSALKTTNMKTTRAPIPKSTLLRFPLVFGGFLAIVAVGLFFKDPWLGDIRKTEKEWDDRNTENKTINEFKRQYNKR